jgi:hypothetical protein
MNSTRLIIIGIVIVCVLAGGIGYTLLRGTPEPGTNGSSFPQSGEHPATPPDTEGAEITLALQDGGEVEVTNFTQDPATKEDPQNPDFYLIGQGAAATRDPSFDITYIAATDFFNISLMQTPLKDARRRAEAYLMTTLGLDEDDMCSLRYSVATPAFVDEAHSGTDLRFSFCPDAMPL